MLVPRFKKVNEQLLLLSISLSWPITRQSIVLGSDMKFIRYTSVRSTLKVYLATYKGANWGGFTYLG